MSNPLDTAALREGHTVCAQGLRQAVMATGPETESFLQGQLSQDITAMAPHDSGWSLLLQPQGKISAWLRVTRLDAETFLLDVDAGWADEVVTRLERFKLRTKCELSVSPHRSLTIIGPGALDAEVTGGEFELHDRWGDLPVVVVFGPEPATDLAQVDGDFIDTLRIEAGRPKMGAELDESTIPASAGIVEQSVSFTKGCYTGQELVARIDSRGNNVPKRLVGLVFEHDTPDAPVAAGSALLLDGKDVGQVTSVGASGWIGGPVAMAYATRAVEIGDSVSIGDTSATVRELPLTPQ